MEKEADIIYSKIASRVMGAKDLWLLRFAIDSKPSQQSLDRFLEEWDIEVAGGHKALLLAYVMKEHPELEFPSSCGPRLKGLLNYYRFCNIENMSHYCKIVSRLAAEGIVSTIFKGGAMRYLRPELPRLMGDIDIIIDASDYHRAGQIVSSMGYDIHWDKHSFDVYTDIKKGKHAVDVHKFIPLLSRNQNKLMPAILSRSQEAAIWGVRSRILCNEDLVFVSLLNMVRNLINGTSTDGILFTMFDVRFLSRTKKGFDWNIVRDNARISGCEDKLSFAGGFLNWIAPDTVPDMAEPSGDILKGFEAMVDYRYKLLKPLSDRIYTDCLFIPEMFRNPGKIPATLSTRPRYTFLKLFRYKPRMARRILSLTGNYKTELQG